MWIVQTQKSGLYINDNAIKKKVSRSKFRASFVGETETPEIQAFLDFSISARLSFLLCCFRFDNEGTGKDRTKENKLETISKVFELFIQNCKEDFPPGEFLMIDQVPVPFRGRCVFRISIPRKQGKYGLKVQLFADSKTHYLVNAEVSTGKETKKLKQNYRIQHQLCSAWLPQ